MTTVRRRAVRRSLPRVVLGLLVALAATASFTGTAAAVAPSHTAGVVDPRTHVPLYRTLAAEWWQWVFSTAAVPGGPFDGVDAHSTVAVDCAVNQPRDEVLFLAAPFTTSGSVSRTCTQPVGINTRIFVPVINTECSSVEETPFLGLTPGKRKQCVNESIFDPAGLYLRVDKTAVAVTEARFGLISQDFSFTAVGGNPGGLPAGPGRSTTRGVWVLLQPLSAGTHTIEFGGSYPNADFVESASYTLTVG